MFLISFFMEEFILILSIPNNKEEKTNENTKEKKREYHKMFA